MRHHHERTSTRVLGAVALCALLGLASPARAQSWSSFAAAFPAFPCQDGWMGCVVGSDHVDPSPRPDSDGRMVPSDLRVGWFDLKASPTFSPFSGLSPYQAPAPAATVAAAEPAPGAPESDDGIADAAPAPAPSQDMVDAERKAEEAAAQAAVSKAAETEAKRQAEEAAAAQKTAEEEAKRQRAEEEAAKKAAAQAAAAAAAAQASEQERLQKEAAAAAAKAAAMQKQRQEADAAAEKQRQEAAAAAAKAQEEEQRRQQAERARQQAEDAARQQAEADRQRQAEEERQRQEAAAKAKAEADAAAAAKAAADAAAAAEKLKAEQEAAAKAQAEAEAKAKATADAAEAQKAQEEAQRLAQEQARLAEEQKQKEEEQRAAEEAARTAQTQQPEPATPQPGAAAGTSGDCTDLSALEPVALLGRLSDDQLSCLESNLASAPKMTDKKKISLVEQANAWHKGDKSEWERLVKRHLEEIDESDPDLCYRYAIYLSKAGASRAQGVIRWSEVALENRSVWTGDTYTSRVNSLYKARAAASQALWQQAETEYAGNNSDATRKKADDYRAMTKVYAREWYEYAKSAGKDTQTALQVCIQAAGTAGYCENE